MPVTIEKLDIILGKNLKTIRKLKSMTLQNLSQIVGISHQQMHKYEKGINRIPSVKLKMIADYFNMDINSFFIENLQTTDIEIDEKITDFVKNLKEILLDKNLSQGESVKIILEEFFKNYKFTP
jgi:transcriptional regulator with XRE-family HTH domain